MIDPITLFATAKAAIAGAQQLIKMGKDVNGIVGDMMKFFDAKDQIAKIAAEPKGFAQSDTSKAFQTVMHLKELNDAENQLKDMLIWSGNAPVWHALIKERNDMVSKRKAQEIALQKKAEKRKKEINEIITIGLIAVLAAVVITLAAWFTILYVEGK
jgi:hypothetical protein